MYFSVGTPYLLPGHGPTWLACHAYGGSFLSSYLWTRYKLKYCFKKPLNLKLCLIGCFRFNCPLRQYFSLCRTISWREAERRENDRREKKYPNKSTRTYCKRSRLLLYHYSNKQDCSAQEVYLAPSHHPTTH